MTGVEVLGGVIGMAVGTVLMMAIFMCWPWR